LEEPSHFSLSLSRFFFNTVVPNLEEKISDEKKERLKLEIWGRKWNLVISGIEGGLEEKPRETETKVRGFAFEAIYCAIR
jgi:hypothetical protein